MPDTQWNPDPGPSQPEVQNPGDYQVGNLFLSSLDFGITLTIKVQVRDAPEGTIPGAYRIYYLSPIDIGDGSIVIDPSVSKLSKQFVGDVPGDRTTSITVTCTPTGAQGGRRDYSLGGWMFASPILANGSVDANTSTSLVRVPTFDKNTSPADQQVNAVSVTSTGPVNGVYTVTLTFKNPTLQFGKTQYCQVFMYNYFNDASFRTMGVYRLHGAPNDPNGQSVVYYLEPDGGGHNVVFYLGYCNGQRSYPFAKVISTFNNSTVVGGFP